MEKLEQYLDQVCRGIGGPWEMREHVRQELREHLLDAVAQHKAAGMPEADALAKALEEFGKPDEVRTDLEATHGRRMAWVIDKALQWKEKTMRAKWLWTTWAYLALALVIALEVMSITFNELFIVPKFRKLLSVGMIDSADLEDQGVAWMVNFLHDVSYIGGEHTLLCLLAPAAAWGLFEWYVRSDNKAFMRLSALGTAAMALMVVVGLQAASLVVPFCLGMPALGKMTRPWAVEQLAGINASVSALEQARMKKDWQNMQTLGDQAWIDMKQLSRGPAVTSLLPWNEQGKAEELRVAVRGAASYLAQAQQAIRAHDERRLETALGEFRKAIEPVRDAAKKPKG